MPVVGVVDPSHDERKRSSTPYRRPKWYPVDVVLEQALRADPKWSPYSYELLNASIAALEERGSLISSTALVAPCPRSLVLERLEDYVADLDRLWRAWRGTMVHQVLEHSARPGSIAETRFFTTVRGEPFSCKPDLLTEDSIWDYKTTRDLPRYDYVYEHHNLQLQLNRYIVNHAERWEKGDTDNPSVPFDPRTTTFRHLIIQYMDADGPKILETQRSVEVATQSKSAKNRTRKVKVPNVWSDEEVRKWLMPRYDALRAAFDSYPEWPDGIEDLWGGEPGWKCPGFPYCRLRGTCLAARYPNGLVWENE